MHAKQEHGLTKRLTKQGTHWEYSNQPAEEDKDEIEKL